jgi:hypothetical protein
MKKSDDIRVGQVNRKKYTAPQITHEDKIARTSMASCTLVAGPGCGVGFGTPSSSG